MKAKTIQFSNYDIFEGWQLGYIGDYKFAAYEIQKKGIRKPTYTVIFIPRGIGIHHNGKVIFKGVATMEKAKALAQAHLDDFVKSLCK